jgi:Raf kinase inhibitor-like YbhB/YbcL family protein
MAIVAYKTLKVKSPAFAHNGIIPQHYTCDGAGLSPELNVQDIPPNTKSLAVIMEDPDAPKGTFDHWVLWDHPVRDRIEEDCSDGTLGNNGHGEPKYTPPCPPSGVHHYRFKVYALDNQVQLPMGTDKTALLKAMDGHILATGELIGLYKK